MWYYKMLVWTCKITARGQNNFSVVMFLLESVFENNLWFYTVEEEPIKNMFYGSKKQLNACYLNSSFPFFLFT